MITGNTVGGAGFWGWVGREIMSLLRTGCNKGNTITNVTGASKRQTCFGIALGSIAISTSAINE